jgi:hypothetical protein
MIAKTVQIAQAKVRTYCEAPYRQALVVIGLVATAGRGDECLDAPPPLPSGQRRDIHLCPTNWIGIETERDMEDFHALPLQLACQQYAVFRL